MGDCRALVAAITKRGTARNQAASHARWNAPYEAASTAAAVENKTPIPYPLARMRCEGGSHRDELRTRPEKT